MNGKEIRECLRHAGKSQLLNMSYLSGKEYGVLAMLAKSEEGVLLWEICQEQEKESEYIRRLNRTPKTNREALGQNLDHPDRPFIKSLRIGEQVLDISSATGTCIGEDFNIQEKVHLIYLIGKGVKLGELEEEPLKRLRMNLYHLEKKELPDILLESERDVSLTFSMQHVPVRVNKRMKLPIGAYKKPRVIHIEGEEEVTVYIYGVQMYDVWKDAATHFQDDRYKDRFTEEQLRSMQEQYIASLPSVCPEGSLIPLVEYECDKGYQMQFYSMEYLRKKPENRGTAVLMNVKPDKETGPMGFRKRLCPLEAVKKGYEGSIAAELFIYYRQIPEKTVICSPL